MERANLQVNNHEGRNKGEFFVSCDGKLIPNTRNPAIWGAINIEGILSKDYLFDEHFKIAQGKHRVNEEGVPIRLSAFFKFQQSNFKAFAESTGMELAYCFNTKTSYNCPAKLDFNEPSIQMALSSISNEDREKYGSLVFSMLDENERLFSFQYILSRDDFSAKENPKSDINCGMEAIKTFVANNAKGFSLEEKLEKIESLQREYCYQYLFRDCFGDVDYTSRNCGLIYNEDTHDISLASNFDFGEMLGILYSSKIKPIGFTDVSTLPEYMTSNPIIMKSIEKSNNMILEKQNMPAYEIGFNNQTFGSESLDNVATSCKKFPDVTLNFLRDLRSFKNSGLLVPLINETAGGKDEQLISSEEKTMVLDYITGKIDAYEQTLVSSLQKYAAKNFLNENKSEIEGQNIKEEATQE